MTPSSAVSDRLAYAFDEDIAYRSPELEACRLDVYHPTNATGFPTIVWFHGGGMVGGERYVPGELRDQGLAVVTADYRLSPGVTAPAYIEDAAAATAWVFNHIAEYGGSPDRIFIGGASAGGYLASLVTLDRRWLEPYGVDPDRALGLVSLSGQAITHFTVRKERGIPETRPVVDELAPLYHVRGDAPPVLLVTGDRNLELFGRYEENAYFKRMLQVAGHPDVELHELPGHDHAMVEASAHAFVLKFINRILQNLNQTGDQE